MKTILDGKKWIALYSRTGQEIVDLSQELGRAPDVIITNISQDDIRDEVIALRTPIYVLPDRPSAEQYFTAFGFDPTNTIITLHGWLRIVPKEVCDKYLIFNGHPGLITQYPELKGFNPQEKAYKLGHKRIGSVVHRVTAEVDEGAIETVASHVVLSDDEADLDMYYRILRDTSMQAWLAFFEQRALDTSALERILSA